jgi:tetratricopeptide (TPR) repeat protein
MTPFLILQVYHPQQTGIGDFIYRIEQPSVAMGKAPGVKVVNINMYSPYLKTFCQEADVLILHMVSDQDMLPVLEHRIRRGLATVFEISDNFLAFQPHDPMKHYFSDPLTLATTFQYVHLTDGVQTTCRELADTFAFLSPNMAVFENQMMSMESLDRPPSQEVTIGWAGSLSHLNDLQWISPVIVEFVRSDPRVRFSYMGTQKGFEYFSNIPDAQKAYTPTGTLHDYYRFLETIHIGIAPLLDTPYNRSRSDIKFIEYASRGVAPVLSALPPYTVSASDGNTALFFSNEEELLYALTRLLRSPELRATLAKNAYAYASENRRQEQHASERIAFYRALCGKRAGEALPDDLLDPIDGDSEAYRVTETEAERIASEAYGFYSKGDIQAEWEGYREAIRCMPDYYVPYLRLGDSLLRHGHPEAAIWLNLATRTCPDSPRSRLLLGLALIQKDRASACARFREAVSISPLYAPAWDALGRVQEQLGDHEKAAECFQLSLKANPFYSLGALGLARVYAAMGKRDEALQTLRIADDILPEHVESRLGLADLYFRTGVIDEAARQCAKTLKLDPENAKGRRLLRDICNHQGNPGPSSLDSATDPGGTSEKALLLCLV